MASANYKCPQCGARIGFNPDLGKVKCEFCLSEFTVEALEEFNRKLEAEAEQATAEKAAAATSAAGLSESSDGEPGEGAVPGDGSVDLTDDHSGSGIRGYHCDSCGAEVVTEENTSATFCYYCHNPVLLTDRLTGDFRPDRVIPFSFGRDKAVTSFLKFAKSRSFVPVDFASPQQLEKITGLYLPYWLADYTAEVNYQGKGINRQSWVSGDTEYTEHQEFRIDRQGVIDVSGVPALALRKIDKELLDSITPYDETQAKPFSLSYLSGFFAERYDISREEVRPGIEDRVRGYADQLVRESFHAYSDTELEREDVHPEPVSWRYTLMPAWILTYLYMGKTYIYAVNGQTGKAHGELPVARGKLLGVALLIALIVLVVILLGGRFIW